MIIQSRTKWFASAAAGIIAFSLPLIVSAQGTPVVFTDVPQSSPVYPALQYLQSKNVFQAAPLFKPNDKITRAQVAKILVAPIVKAEELAKITKSSFSDVASTAWYMPYAEAAKLLGIVDAAPTFSPDKVVTKAGFMKMLLLSKKIDYKTAFGDFSQPLSPDVPNTTDWFFPVMRYSIASSMTAVGKDGLLSPSREMTRGDVALLYYRLEMYASDRRTQALLSQTETDIGNVLQALNGKDIQQARFASARAMLAARGALASRPTEPLIKGAVKVSEGFQSLVLAYQAGIGGDFDGVLKNAKDAYGSAEKAKSFSQGLAVVAGQMETIAKNMADEARKTKAASSAPAK